MTELNVIPPGEPAPALPPGEAAPMAGLVDYAPASIVSRTLRKGPAGSLTLFAFDAGQDLSEHTSPFDAWVCVLEGRAELAIGGKPVDAPAGTVTRMPAGVPHAVKARERFKMLLVMMRD